MKVDTSETGDLNAGLDLAKQHGADLAYLPKTTRTYRLGSFDTLPAVDEFFYTYVQRSGRWYIAADDDMALLGLQNSPSLFDFGPVVTTQSTHFLVLAGAENAARAKELDAIAEEGIAALTVRLKLSWSERIPILVPDSPKQAADLLRTTNDVANFVAFVGYTPIRDDDSYTITAPRVFSQEENLAAQSRSRQVSTFTHELTHAATAPQGGPFTATWIHEGLAEYIRNNRPATYPYPTNTRSVPEASAFSSSGATLTNAYQASTSAMAYVAQLGGPDAPERLFLALGKRRVTPGTSTYNVDAAFQSVLGMGLTEFQRKWLGTSTQ